MSATPSEKIIEEFKNENSHISYLYKRFHNHAIPVPKVLLRPKLLQIYFILKKIKEYQSKHKPLLIFVPTIGEGEKLLNWLKIFVTSIDLVHSKKENRDELVTKFKKREIGILITTSILERGITIENLQVIVFMADHTLFNDQNLTQIAGRVGRKIKSPTGDVYFLAYELTKAMERSINSINEANKHL